MWRHTCSCETIVILNHNTIANNIYRHLNGNGKILHWIGSEECVCKRPQLTNLLIRSYWKLSFMCTGCCIPCTRGTNLPFIEISSEFKIVYLIATAQIAETLFEGCVLLNCLYTWLGFGQGPDQVYSGNASCAIKFDIYLLVHIWQKSVK